MRIRQSAYLAVAAALALAGPAAAQAGPGGVEPEKPAVIPSTFRTEFIRQLDDVEKKLVSLAEAVPADKYDWRPGTGVRSIGEVYAHVAGGNWFLMSFVGLKPPAGTDPASIEKKVTEKPKLIAAMKESFAAMRKAAFSSADAAFDGPANFFGRDTTVRDVYFTAALHLHEHLGQSIAYARSVGVTPPWTEARAKAAAAKDKPNTP